MSIKILVPPVVMHQNGLVPEHVMKTTEDLGPSNDQHQHGPSSGEYFPIFPDFPQVQDSRIGPLPTK